MNRDQIKGRIKEAEGEVKEVTGKSVGSYSRVQKGELQKTVGKYHAGSGDLKDDLKKVNELALAGDVYEL